MVPPINEGLESWIERIGHDVESGVVAGDAKVRIVTYTSIRTKCRRHVDEEGVCQVQLRQKGAARRIPSSRELHFAPRCEFFSVVVAGICKRE